MSFAIDGSRDPTSTIPSFPVTGFSCVGCVGCSESEFQFQFQFQFAACTYNSRWYFQRPSYTETRLEGVWFQLLTCTTAGTRSHCHIVATLGSSTRQQTVIVGGLTVLRRGFIAVIPRGVRTKHTIYTVLGTSREPIGSLLVAS